MRRIISLTKLEENQSLHLIQKTFKRLKTDYIIDDDTCASFAEIKQMHAN